MKEPPVISSLLNKTFPEFGFKFPAIKLNKVVFPEPFGPIMPVIDPFLIFKEQFETAANPPKYFEIYLFARIFRIFCILKIILFLIF